MRYGKKMFMLLPLGALLVAVAPQAFASEELTLSDGAGDSISIGAVSSTSGSVGIIADGCVGQQCTIDASVGNWNINVTTGTASPGSSPEMDLNSIDHRNPGATGQTLTITWAATDFSPAASGFGLNIGGTIGSGGTLSASLYGGNSNTLGDQSHQDGTTLTFTNPPSISFSGSENTFLNSLSPNPYSLTEVVTMNFGAGAGQASFDYSVDAVPEPAGVVLLGSAMLFVVSAVRRKVGKRA
jgi:hypothetical protein